MSEDFVPGRRLPRPVRMFLATEVAGGVVLLGASCVALVWANSPWQHTYVSLWRTDLSIGLGRWVISEDLRHWVNDGLMALFFFVVGLEVKRELVKGELREVRAAALPVLAAVGGMIVPALLYAVVNLGRPGGHGWGIPMATDIAFALGVLAILGSRAPASLKVFLLTLAIVDDIGAIVVIAVVYSRGIDGRALGIAVASVVLMVLLRKVGIVWLPLFVILGVVVWVATHASGIHPTIAGVVLGLLCPIHPLAPARVARTWLRQIQDEPAPGDLAAMTNMARASVSVAERLEYLLHPWTGFVVVPLFALANAGVVLRADSLDGQGTVAVAGGVVAGLVVGKCVGILFTVWVAVRIGISPLPTEVTWGQMAGVAMIAGIGFTVSLFIAGLAFPGEAHLEDAAKLGILVASAVAAVTGAWLVARSRPTHHGGGDGDGP